MDDLKMIREMRSDVPEADPARLARIDARWKGQASLLATATSVKSRSRNRWKPVLGREKLRLAMGAAAAGLTVAAVISSVVLAQSDTAIPRPGDTSVGTDLSASSFTASRFLLASAEQLEKNPAAKPDQWVYVKSKEFGTRTRGTPSGLPSMEVWSKADGTRFAFKRPHEELREYPTVTPGEEEAHPPVGPAASYQALTALPLDPNKLLKYIEEHVTVDSGDSRNEQVFLYVSSILNARVPLPPKTAAALYRVMALIPAVRVEQGVIDLAGRRGVGVSVGDGGPGMRYQLIIDGRNGRYLGFRNVVIDAALVNSIPHSDGRGQSVSKPSVHNGQVVSASAILAVAVVDRAGQRP